MHVTVSQEKQNPLLGRKELSGTLDFTGKATPALADVQKAVADHSKAAPETVAVKKVITSFGAGTAQFEAFVYASTDELARIEPKKKAKKAKPGEAPAEEKK